METIDDETSDATVDFITRQAKAGKPFFCWHNSTRMHAFTHVKDDRRDKPGLTARTEYNDGMIEHDGHVGKILKALDDLGIANDTIALPHGTGRAEPAARVLLLQRRRRPRRPAVRELEGRVHGAARTMRVWAEPFTPLRVPKMYDLRADAYEQADITSNTYYQWFLEQGYLAFAATTVTAQFLETFKEFPPSQRAASFTIDQAMEKLRQGLGGN
jgi:hypothetical protein